MCSMFMQQYTLANLKSNRARCCVVKMIGRSYRKTSKFKIHCTVRLCCCVSWTQKVMMLVKQLSLLHQVPSAVYQYGPY